MERPLVAAQELDESPAIARQLHQVELDWHARDDTVVPAGSPARRGGRGRRRPGGARRRPLRALRPGARRPGDAVILEQLVTAGDRVADRLDALEARLGKLDPDAD